MMKESDLQREVEKLLMMRGPRLAWHHCAGRALHCRGTRGVPDLVIIGNSVLWAELKKHGGHGSRSSGDLEIPTAIRWPGLRGLG